MHLLDDEHYFEPYDGGAGRALFGTDTWTAMLPLMKKLYLLRGHR